MTLIDISGLDKADVLVALYNASRPQGMGFLHYTPEPMTRAEAEGLLRDRNYFDYLRGRVMKVEITNPLDTRLYDRDNGPNAGELVISALRVGLDKEIAAQLHEAGKKAAAQEMKAALDTPTRIEDHGSVAVFHLGVDDVAEPLSDAIDRALASE